MTNDWKTAAEALEKLKITHLTRQTPVEALHDLLVYKQVNGANLLPGRYTWTSRRASDGYLVNIGYFDAGGASVSGHEPDYVDDDIGVSLSRSS